MPGDTQGQQKGKDGAPWKPHFNALASALEAADGVDLLEANKSLVALVAKVAKRVKSQGGGTLVERMALAASSATSSPLSVQDAKRLFADMTAKIRVRVVKADPCKSLIAVTAIGTWGLSSGQSFNFKASVKEVLGNVTGQINVEGLGFKADGNISTGKFTCDTKALLKPSGITLSESDALRAFVVALELLARRKAVGIADVDVLSVTFGLMRQVCGLPAESAAGEASSDAEPESDNESVGEEDEEAAASEEAASEEVASEADQLLQGHEQGEEEEKDEDAEEEASDEEVEKEDPMEASPAASSAGGLPTKESDDEDEKKSEDAGQDNEDGDVDKSKKPEVESEEDTTVFVSMPAFKAVKNKLTKGQVPTQAQLTRLADFDGVPEGEDVVCIDAAVLGAAFTSPDGNRKDAVKALVAAHGLKGLADLFMKAEEAAHVDMADDESEEEESEEEKERDEEVEASEDEAPRPPRAKAAAAKAASAKAAPVSKSPMKTAAAKQPAAKRPRTS